MHSIAIEKELKVYPIIVEFAIETEGPTTVPEAIRTFEPTTDSE